MWEVIREIIDSFFAEHHAEHVSDEVRALIISFRRTPHPVIVTIKDNRDYIGSSYIPVIPLLQGWGSS